jgi:hypothetical protein
MTLTTLLQQLLDLLTNVQSTQSLILKRLDEIEKRL